MHLLHLPEVCGALGTSDKKDRDNLVRAGRRLDIRVERQDDHVLPLQYLWLHNAL